MAKRENTTSRRGVIAPKPAEPMPEGMALCEEVHKEGHDDATTAFARAWLAYWRSIGNSFGTSYKNPEAPEVWFGVDMLLDALPLRTDLPPHLRIYSHEHHEGATRALEVLLGSVPGCREAVLSLVKQGV